MAEKDGRTSSTTPISGQPTRSATVIVMQIVVSVAFDMQANLGKSKEEIDINSNYTLIQLMLAAVKIIQKK